jgi:hypothetical protein
MNRHGIILSELGFAPDLLDPLVYKYINSIASCLLPVSTKGLDSYRAFTVLYDVEKDGERDLSVHRDNAEVTVNVNIGGSWDGGAVTFYGQASSMETRNPDLEVKVGVPKGRGIVHAGLDWHKATPIMTGRRHNLIIWCRSSGIRNQHCNMCWSVPQVIPTNRYGHEGFSVPPCRLSSAFSSAL